MQSSLVSKFTRRVAFGVPGDQGLPADPVAWASAQVVDLPPIDVLEPHGKRRQDLPADMRLLWSMDEVMHAFEQHRQVFLFRTAPGEDQQSRIFSDSQVSA